MQDRYKSFKELSQKEKKEDYKIICEERDSNTLILVPHGGNIEYGTSEIGREIANNKFSFYCFEGKKKNRNRGLHIKSTNFDEPKALELVDKSYYTLTIHGFKKKGKITYVGGRDEDLREKIIDKLKESNFKAELPNNSKLKEIQGIEEENICNRNKRLMGVQLEICKGLRKEMFFNFRTERGREKKTELFKKYTISIRDVLIKFTQNIV